MLDAAMQRKYSASPGEAFFTGRGMHVFANFDKTHNRRIMPVAEAFRYSVNLVFIRMMRDIVRYYQADGPEPVKAILADREHPARREYLERFADMEGRVFIDRFYRRYRDRIAGRGAGAAGEPHPPGAAQAGDGLPIGAAGRRLRRVPRLHDEAAAERTSSTKATC